MGSNSVGQGSFLASHPDVEEINRMLQVGNTPDEVSNWLKVKHKNKRYWASPASIQNYRKNVLNLGKAELAQRRAQLLEEGKTKSANGLMLHATTTDLIESKQQLKTKLMGIVENYQTVQDAVLDRIKLIQTQTVDDMGQPIFKRSNDEMLEKYLGRLESMSNSFVKVARDIMEEESKGNGPQTNITITTAEVQKYAEIFKGVFQRLVAKFDPTLLPEVFQDFDSEMAKLNGQAPQNQVKISVDGQGNNQINIVTGAAAAAQLPSVEEVTIMAQQMTNENDYIPELETINPVIETKIDS